MHWEVPVDDAVASWQSFAQFTADYIDPIGIWLGLVVAVPIFATWYQVTVGRRRRYRRWAREIRQVAGNRPAILVVDLLEGRSVLSSVERFRAGVEALSAIPAERLFVISRERRIGTDDMPGLSQELRVKAGEILQNGTDVLHVFFGGPCIAAALVGAEFANACRVILYHQDQGAYLNWGPLRHLPD